MGKILALFSNFSPAAVWILFFFFFAVVLLTSILIPRFLVTLFRTSRLKMAFFGVFFVAIITSAPELISAIMLGWESRGGALASSGDHLTQGWANIFGSNICTFLFLALFHLLIFFQEKRSFRRSGWGTIFSLITLLIFDIFYILTFVPAFSWWGANIVPNVAITPMGISLFIGYAFFLFLSFRLERKSATANGGAPEIKIKNKTTSSKNRMNSLTVVFVCFLLASALVLSMLGTIPLVQKIKENHNISDVAIGGLLLTFITSSPEIWSTISFFWMGYLSAAVGVILGSQIFNLLLIQVMQVVSGENIIVHFKHQKISETLGTLLIAFGINVSATIYYFLNKNSVRRIVSVFWIPVLFLVFFFFSHSF